jgi:predicted DNA binding CopG/RHH family protein
MDHEENDQRPAAHRLAQAFDGKVRPCPSTVTAAESEAVDRSLGLQLISIRLPAAMIEDFKMIAKLRGTLYQPLIREALSAWIDEAKTDVLKGLIFDREHPESAHSEGRDS